MLLAFDLCSWRSSKPATEGGGFPVPCLIFSVTAFGSISYGESLRAGFRRSPVLDVAFVGPWRTPISLTWSKRIPGNSCLWLNLTLACPFLHSWRRSVRKRSVMMRQRRRKVRRKRKSQHPKMRRNPKLRMWALMRRRKRETKARRKRLRKSRRNILIRRS